MYKEILNQEQKNLLKLMSEFRREFYLVGDTAIALHLGHRQSIDFDMFKQSTLNINKIFAKIADYKLNYKVTRRVSDQLNLMIQNVKLTFFQYPFTIETPCKFENTFKMPDLLTLAAMKAYALGRRAKWKDYVDMYFILKYHYTIPEITKKATMIYKDLYSEKMFRAQLCFFDDIDYTEQVIYCSTRPNDSDLKSFLSETAINF